tara:strand:- start:759 stop:1406 length:648 start_codon:yes stop_codon:yes gene_type:complete
MPEQSNESKFPIICRYTHKDNPIPNGWEFTLLHGHHGRSGYGVLTRQKDDFYPTPPEAVEALINAEKLPKDIWECACGDGAISKPLIASNHNVISTDLNDWGYGKSGVDFLMECKPLAPAVVTNPPYKLANEFVIKCMDMKLPYFAMLLRLAFLEGKQRRADIYDRQPPARVHVFSERLTMWRGDQEQPEGSSGFIAFAWFVWEQGNTDTRLDWI